MYLGKCWRTYFISHDVTSTPQGWYQANILLQISRKVTNYQLSVSKLISHLVHEPMFEQVNTIQWSVATEHWPPIQNLIYLFYCVETMQQILAYSGLPSWILFILAWRSTFKAIKVISYCLNSILASKVLRKSPLAVSFFTRRQKNILTLKLAISSLLIDK